MNVTERPYKILVVDDEPDLQPLFLQRMRRSIRSGRYQFVFAGNGLEAIERLHQEKDIDMVLSDINMPKMDGLALLKQIPQIDPNLRAVIISAYGDMKNIRTAMNRGAFDFVTKPIDFKDLQFTIDRTLERMEEWREALSSRDKLVVLQNELDVAGKIQQSILPTEFPRGLDYQVFGNMVPARNVGGDFFDTVRLDKGRVGLTIADVSDKGVPSALFMMASRSLLKGAAIGAGGPGAVLSEVNRLLHDDNKATMFVTILYAVYDPDDGALTYANGGHNPPLIVHADGSSMLLPLTDGIAVGILPEFDYDQNTVFLSPGDTIVFYTDGVTEAMNDRKEEFGMERLRDVLSADPSRDAREANLAIFQAIDAFVGDTSQFDDITCLTLRRKETDT